MTQHFSADIDFEALFNLVLRELKEPEATGSEAVSLDMVKDTLNVVYAEAFNDQRMKQSARETDVTFTVSDDTTLNGQIVSGAATVTLNDSSSWQSAGRALLTSDIITYTGNAANQLTGVTGVQATHEDGAVIRQIYELQTLASDIQGDQIQYVDVNGIPQQYMPYETMINNTNYLPNAYTVYKNGLILSRQPTPAVAGTLKCLMIYTQVVTKLTDDTDTPTLIPNSWRVPILVYGACMKIAASDAFRTSWDWWEKQYNDALSKYIAFKNNRVRDRNNKRRPSIYQRYFP